MKIDGAEIAKAFARRKENEKNYEPAGEDAINDQVMEGSHIQHMASFIECIHKGSPEEAHKYMQEYMKASPKKDEEKEV